MPCRVLGLLAVVRLPYRAAQVRRETKMVTCFKTWKCHICGEERPDEKISVLSKPLVINGQIRGEQNIRYCNDRPGCIDGAKEFSFFKEK